MIFETDFKLHFLVFHFENNSNSNNNPKTPKPQNPISLHVIAILKKIYREIYNNYSDLIYNIFVLMVG